MKLKVLINLHFIFFYILSIKVDSETKCLLKIARRTTRTTVISFVPFSSVRSIIASPGDPHFIKDSVTRWKNSERKLARLYVISFARISEQSVPKYRRWEQVSKHKKQLRWIIFWSSFVLCSFSISLIF